MENVIIIGLTVGPIWGCIDLPWAKGQSADESLGGETQKLLDGNGNTIAVAYYDDQENLSFTGKITGAIPENLKRGTWVDVQFSETSTKSYVIENVTFGRRNNDFTEVRLELTKYKLINKQP